MKFSVAVFVGEQGGVVTGANRVKAKRESLFEKRGELDSLIATHTRIWSSTGFILGDEFVYDFFLESLREIPNVVRDSEHASGTLGVHRIFDGAAASRTGAKGAWHARKREVNTNHLMPRFDRSGSGNGRVNSTRHCR
jgi:hypothetical protein